MATSPPAIGSMCWKEEICKRPRLASSFALSTTVFPHLYEIAMWPHILSLTPQNFVQAKCA